MPRSHQHQCQRCKRPQPRRRLTDTKLGQLCERCRDRLGPALRRAVS